MERLFFSSLADGQTLIIIIIERIERIGVVCHHLKQGLTLLCTERFVPMHTTKHTHKLAQLAYLLVAHPFIYSITFYEVLLKHLICPLAELHTALALNAITNGDYNIK